MIVDSHQHFWEPARGDYGWMSGEGAAPIRKTILPRDFEAIRKANSIERTVLVQAADSVAESDYMLGLADATDYVAKVVGWVDFEKPESRDALARLARHPKFSGARPMIQDIADKDWMHRADVQWAYAALIDLDLTFDALGYPIHADNFLKLFNRYPKLRVVVDHCLKPVIRNGEFDGWAKTMSRIASETTAYCKLSGLATEAKAGWTVETLKPYAQHILDAFGPERVMWGSDWPVLTLNGDYAGWLKAARSYVPEKHHTAVFGGNACKFYRIS